MADFINTFNRLASLNEDAEKDLLNCLATKKYDKGDALLNFQGICRKLYFIDQGLVKIAFSKKDSEFIMRFFPEHTLFTVVDSFTMQSPSNYQIIALEHTQVTYIMQYDLEMLCKKHHCIEHGFRKLLSIAVLNMMKRVSEMLEDNGTERYRNFLSENGVLMQRISLGDLASYLGITQVSLSRIRASK